MIERVREFYWAKPFLPFTFFLADGRSITVTHPEFLALSPSGDEVIVYDSQGAVHFINLSLVTGLSVKTDKAGAAK